MSHKVILTYRKSTPGTHVFENPEDTHVRNVYIRKEGYPKPPKAIVLIIDEWKEGEESLTT